MSGVVLRIPFIFSYTYICICSELKRENIWSRIHLTPLILAENDRDAYRRQQAQIAREKEIMKDVKDWEVRHLYYKFGSVVAY